MNTLASTIRRPIPNPLTLWHLLSLDAPTVAVTWTIFIARVTHAPLAPAIPLAMFLAVWALYVADRLLDASRVPNDQPQPKGYGGDNNSSTGWELQPRHLFHRQYRRRFTLALLAASPVLFLLLFRIPRCILVRYFALASLLSLWFLTIHLFAKHAALRKEFLPGPFFAAAVFISSWSPALTPAAFCFALLCTLNCLYIHAWEQPPVSAPPGPRLSLRSLPALSILAAVLPLIFLPNSASLAPVFLAISLSAALFLLLHRFHSLFEPTTLRAAADLALLTPLLVAPFLR